MAYSLKSMDWLDKLSVDVTFGERGWVLIGWVDYMPTTCLVADGIHLESKC